MGERLRRREGRDSGAYSCPPRSTKHTPHAVDDQPLSRPRDLEVLALTFIEFEHTGPPGRKSLVCVERIVCCSAPRRFDEHKILKLAKSG